MFNPSFENQRRLAVLRESRRAVERREDPGLNTWRMRAMVKQAYEYQRFARQTLPAGDPTDPRGE